MGYFRLFLALSVVFDHAPILPFLPDLFPGPLAVQCFFVISGFYIALILDTKYSDKMVFWSNRALRIFPTYLAVLAITIAFLIISNSQIFDRITALGFFPAALLVLSHLSIVGLDLTLFITHHGGAWHFDGHFLESDPRIFDLSLIAPAWSLALELYFYMLAPFLLRLRTRALTAVIAVLLVARVVAWQYGFDADPWNYRFFPLELVLFLFGALSYRLYRKYAPRLKPFRFSGWLWMVPIALLIAYRYEMKYGLSIEAAGWVLLVILIPLVPTLFHYTKDKRKDRFIGELSYPVYLVHYPIIDMVKFYFGDSNAFVKNFMIFGAIFALAILLHIFLEKPIDAWRARRAASQAAPSGVIN